MKKPKLTAKQDYLPCSQETLLHGIDYLHGHVVDNAFEAACYYEYARESAILREAATVYKAVASTFELERSLEAKRRKKIGWPPPVGGRPGGVEIYLAVEGKFNCGSWFMNAPWSMIWKCPSFPDKGWNRLSKKERADVGFPSAVSRNKVRPLTTHDVSLLNGMGLFNQFIAMAKDTWAERATPGHPSDTPALYQGWPEQKQREKRAFLHVLFTLNLTLEDAPLVEQFRAWLRLPDIEKLRKPFEKSTRGATGTLKDRLKDLTAWRLLRTLSSAREASNFADEHRKHKNGSALPFHDARRPQGKKEMLLEDAPLFSENTGFREAQTRALDYLATLMPAEFVNLGEPDSPISDGENPTAEDLEKLPELLKKAEFHDLIPEQRATVVFYKGNWRFISADGKRLLPLRRKSRRKGF